MRKVLVLLLLFAVPFIVLPFGTSQFEIPKVFASEGLIILLSLYSIYKFKKTDLPRTDTLLPFFILFLLIIYDLIFQQSSTSFFGNTFRFQGTFLIILLTLFSFFSRKIELKKISFIAIFIILVTHLLGAIFIQSPNERAVGFLGEANSLAAYALFCMPFLFFLSKQNKKTFLIQLLGILITLTIILVSGSRSSFIGFFIQLTFLGLIHLKFLSLKKIVIICLILFMFSLTLPFLEKDRLYENRSEIWYTAFVAGTTHPILGYGFGNTEKALQKTIKSLKNNLRGYYIDSSHNIFLDWWVQGGIIGLGIFLFAIFKTLKTFIKHQEKRLLMIFLGLIAVLSFNPASIVILVAFWWVLGQGVFDSSS